MEMTRKQAEAAMAAIDLARMDCIAEIKRFNRMRSATPALKAYHIAARDQQLEGLKSAHRAIGEAFKIYGY